VIIVVGVAAGVFLLWAAWWFYRGTPKHGKHRTTLPAVAAHHPLPTVVDLGPDTATWPAPRHTHRDPTTGRYTPRDKL